jgi:glucokinase
MLCDTNSRARGRSFVNLLYIGPDPTQDRSDSSMILFLQVTVTAKVTAGSRRCYLAVFQLYSTMNPVIAVDLGATNIRVAKISGDGIIENKISALTPVFPESPEDITDAIIRMVRSVAGGKKLSELDGIGISAAGPVNSHLGIVLNPPNIAIPAIPLAGPISEEFAIPVRLINDCPAGALGEMYFGDGKGCRDFVYITISTGIGGGVVSNGKILLGRNGNAAEIGHFHVDTRYNALCGCGCTGHWEAYVSGRHIPDFFSHWCQEHNIVITGDWARSPSGIFEAARNGYPGLSDFMDEFSRINARGVSNVIVAYDPSRIILDGSVILNNSDLLLPRLNNYVDRFLPLPEIMVSRLNGLAPLLGASVIAHGYDTAAGSLLAGEE